MVGIVVFLVYKSCWSGHSSNAASRVNSDEKEKIEICVEPSTSSQEPSPVTKRSQRYHHMAFSIRLYFIPAPKEMLSLKRKKKTKTLSRLL